MISRARLQPPIPLLAFAALLTLAAMLGLAQLAPPASAAAASSGGSPPNGGAAAGPGSTGTRSPNAPGTARVHSANTVVTASGNGITVQTTASGLRGHGQRFTGRAPSGDAGDVAVLERATPAPESRWTAVAEAAISRGGDFSVVWRANASGHLALRVLIAPPSSAPARSARSTRAHPGDGAAPAAGPATPPLTITVFRPAVATFYGPGFWGHRTACGQRLRRSTLGVASRTLACGTRVTVLYRGRTITVPVIDRGPYARGVTWDLTAATAQALGITETATVGTVAGARARG